MKNIVLILGAGFSYDAGMPMGKDLNDFFKGMHWKSNLLKATSSEYILADRRTENEVFNCRNNSASDFTYSTVISNFEAYTKEYLQSNSEINYEEFFAWLQTKIDSSELLGAFQYCISEKLKIQDGMHFAKTKSEFYYRFNEIIKANKNVTVASLNHNLVLETLFNYWAINYNDGFSIYESKIEADGLTLRTFNEKNLENNDSLFLLKLHGSIDLYGFQHSKEDRNLVMPTGKVSYFKTLSYTEKHHAEIVGKQKRNWGDITPQFITGTNKEVQIQNNEMYKSLYEKFQEKLKAADTIIFIGYSFSDNHINKKIENSVLNIKKIVNVNNSKPFPKECFQGMDFNSVEIVDIDVLSNLELNLI